MSHKGDHFLGDSKELDHVNALNNMLDSQEISNPAKLELFDAHSHLQLDSLYSRFDRIVETARRTGVSKCCVCGVSPGDDWTKVINLYERQPDFIVPNFGLHPWWIDQLPTDPSINWQQSLEQTLQAYSGTGVGECGLDKVIKKRVSLEVQEAILIDHISLASRYNRPLTLHCVGAWGRLLQVLESQTKDQYPSSIVLHSCNSLPVEMVTSFLKLPNVFFSFSGSITGKEKTCQLLRSIPLNALLLETDSPDQTPREVSARLSYNEPAVLRVVLAMAAKELGIGRSELAAITRENTNRAYSL